MFSFVMRLSRAEDCVIDGVRLIGVAMMETRRVAMMKTRRGARVMTLVKCMMEGFLVSEISPWSDASKTHFFLRRRDGFVDAAVDGNGLGDELMSDLCRITAVVELLGG